MKTAFILWQRQLRKYLRTPSRIIGTLGQPLFFLLALGYGFGEVFRQAGQGDYLQFLSPGVVAMSILFTAIFGGIEVIWDKQFGFLKETLVAPVSRFQIFLGRTLGGATVAVLQGVIVIVLSMLFGFRPEFGWSLLLAFLFMLLMGILFTALGTGIASIIEDMQGFQIIMQFLVMPMFFLSGAMFPIAGLPKLLSYIVHANPMTYCVDAIRGLLTATNHFPLWLDFTFAGATALLFLVIGSYLFERIKA